MFLRKLRRMEFKDELGRLTDAGVIHVHRLRDAYRPDRIPKDPARTLQSIAEELGVCLGTIHNTCKGKNHGSLHPLKGRYWLELAKLEFLEKAGK